MLQRSVGVDIRPGHAIHLGRDAVEEGEAIVSGLIDIEMGTARQEGELGLSAKVVKRGPQTVRGKSLPETGPAKL